MDANKAVELGFADEIMARAKAGADGGENGKEPPAPSSMLFSRRAVNNALFNKMAAKYGQEEKKPDIRMQAQIPAPETETGRSVDALMERLHLLRH